jgi:hypothetical protein
VTDYKVWALLPLAALVVAASASESRAVGEASAPIVVGATPHDDPTDRPGGGFLRVTFSPDGDGRNDRVAVRVRAKPGEVVVLTVHPDSNRTSTIADIKSAVSGATTLIWDALEADGKPVAAGSYVLTVCRGASNVCARTRVLAHLRIVSVWAPRAQAVSVGEQVPVVVETDRAGPYVLDLAPASNPRAAGVGAQVVNGPGRLLYSIPRVVGGLWLLRVTSGRAVGHFPLVVHEPSLSLASPPHGTALVVYPYITWRAYDRADLDRDGEVDSWYAHPRRPVVRLLGRFEQVRRELSRAGREAEPEKQQVFATWLWRHALFPQHVTDVELRRMPLAELRRYAVIVFPGHTEYYERTTYDKLLAYRAGGGRLYFLSGNSFYGEVKIGRSTIMRRSYRFRTQTHSDFRIAATGFRSCCWPKSIEPHYRLAPGVSARLPWLLDGTYLKDGDAFGIADGEVDTVDAKLSPPGTVTIASATIPPYASRNTRPLAWVGSRSFPYERAGKRVRRIDIAYAATGLGEVFSWGNTGFALSLFDEKLPPRERAALDHVALNVWKRFTR